LLPGLDALAQSYDGFGAFEQQASGTGIAARAFHLTGQEVDAKAVFEAAGRGEKWAQQVVDVTIDYLTWMVANVTAVLDPEVVVLSGGVMASARGLAETLERQVKMLLPFAPRVCLSTLGARATTLGATMLVKTSVENHV
jgi:predicted NBD/HSP70 family sugar kinase